MVGFVGVLEYSLDSGCDWSGEESVMDGLVGFWGVGDPMWIEVEEVVAGVPCQELYISVLGNGVLAKKAIRLT